MVCSCLNVCRVKPSIIQLNYIRAYGFYVVWSSMPKGDILCYLNVLRIYHENDLFPLIHFILRFLENFCFCFFSFLFSVPLSFESGRIESLGITFLFVKILILWKHINISLPFSCIFCCCSSLHWFIYYCNLLLRFDLNKCDEPEANVNSKSNVGKGTKK